MSKKATAIILTVVFLFSFFPTVVLAENNEPEPQKIIEEGIREVLQLLEDSPVYTPEDLHRLRPKIQDVIEPLFGFEEITLRTLGRHARAASEKQLEKIVPLYRELLENIILNSLTPIVEHSNEPLPIPEVEITGSESRESGAVQYARVFSTARINPQNDEKRMEVKLNYRLVKREENWIVYDLEIEGVSMVGNYRSQFDDIITRQSLDGLISTLEERIRQFEEDPQKAREEVEDWLPDTDEEQNDQQ